MEMQQIRYFLSLSQTLNFTRAAQDCNVTQPALTRAIQSLEAELGGELIRRERQHSHLTELGRRMLPLLQQCFDAAVSAQTLARAVKSNDVAPLSLAVSRSVNIAVFISPLGELFRAYPGVQLKLKRGSRADVAALLKSGDAELAIAEPLGETWERLDSWPIFEETFALVVNRDHRLGRWNEIEVAELDGEHVLLHVDCDMAGALARHLGTSGVAAATSHEVETDHDLIALLEANAGIGFLPASSPHSTTLRRLPLKGRRFHRTVAVHGVAGRQRSAVATTLLNLLRATDWPDFDVPEPP